MKPECKSCVHFKQNVCVKEQKNSYNQCKKFKAIPMSEIIKERNSLLISKDNPERLDYLTEKLKHFNGGTV